MCRPPASPSVVHSGDAPAGALGDKSPTPAPRARGFLEHVSSVLTAVALWTLLCLVPLVCASRYERIWPASWYAYDPHSKGTPSPLGLSLGILAVAVGQMPVLAYQFARWRGSRWFGPTVRIQSNEIRTYDYGEGAASHLAQPEGFALIGGYLTATWLLRMMPHSYYAFTGGIDWARVFACLLTQDALQYGMHRLEHKASKALYRASHEPHHQFTNPRLFDAFNGSFTDTCLMIVIPLYATANIVHCNVWTYMAFGSLYANWLCLIHSESHHAWDSLFAACKFGTAADHHVHHLLFVSNYGHLFMYWDMLCGTYRNPKSVGQFRDRKSVV